MPTDIRLDDPTELQVTVDAAVLKVTGSDLMLDAQARRNGKPGPHRRALVHSEGDGLTVNFNGDYTGGVVINGARLRLFAEDRSALSKDGRAGDLVLVRERVNLPGTVALRDSVTLWLCIGPSKLTVDRSAYWVPIATGEPVKGV